MKLLLSLIIAILGITIPSIAYAESTKSFSYPIGMEVHRNQNNPSTTVHRAPMNIVIDAIYNPETNAIEITYNGDFDGEVFIYKDNDIIEWGTEINTSFLLPSASGLYTIKIITDNWIALGYLRL